MRFKFCIDENLLIRPIDDHIDILKEIIHRKMDVDVEIELGYMIKLYETILCYRLGVCEQDNPDTVMDCIKYNEYCKGALHETAYNEDINLIIMTRNSPIPVCQPSEDKNIITRGMGLTYTFPSGYKAVLFELGCEDILPHEMGHALGLSDCEDTSCLMNNNFTNIIRSNGLCNNCSSALAKG